MASLPGMYANLFGLVAREAVRATRSALDARF